METEASRYPTWYFLSLVFAITVLVAGSPLLIVSCRQKEKGAEESTKKEPNTRQVEDSLVRLESENPVIRRAAVEELAAGAGETVIQSLSRHWPRSRAQRDSSKRRPSTATQTLAFP